MDGEISVSLNLRLLDPSKAPTDEDAAAEETGSATEEVCSHSTALTSCSSLKFTHVGIQSSNPHIPFRVDCLGNKRIPPQTQP